MKRFLCDNQEAEDFYADSIIPWKNIRCPIQCDKCKEMEAKQKPKTMTKKFDCISLNGYLYLIDKDADVIVGDWYYTSLERDLPWVQKCRSVSKSEEYWLDFDLKYLMKHISGGKETNYGSAKIIASNDPALTDGRAIAKIGELEEDVIQTLIKHCDTLIDSNKNLGEPWVQSFISGVNAVFGRINSIKAASNKKYTEEDMINAFRTGIVVGMDSTVEAYHGTDRVSYWNQKEVIYLKSLKPIPKEIEIEMVEIPDVPAPHLNDSKGHTSSGIQKLLLNNKGEVIIKSVVYE